MKRKVSVCAGVVAAVMAFSAGAEAPKPAGGQSPGAQRAAEPTASRPDAVVAPTVEGPGTERGMAAPPPVDAVVGGSVSAAPATDSPVVAQAKAEPGASAEAAEVHIPFSLTLLPGVSTSGFHTGNVVNTVSIGLIATHAKRVEGVAMSLGGNWVTAGLRGAQLALGGNMSQGPVTGAQLAVGLNVAGGPVRGVQAAMGANVAPEVSGMQMSSGVSYARRISGGQLSLLNVGGEVEGAQVGLVNVASRVDGAQVGLVNVAGRTEGESVGLLSFVGNGQAHVQVWASDVSLSNVGLKLGGRHLYTLLTAGFTPPLDGERRRYVFGAGFGGHVPLGRFYVDVDVVGSTLQSGRLFEEHEHVLAQLRLMAGWQVARRFAVYAGVTSNTLVSWDSDERWEELGIGPEWREVSDGGRTVARTWPGVLVGVQL